MLFRYLFLSAFLGITCSCQTFNNPETEIFESLNQIKGLDGKAEYRSSPFVTAGDRVYLIGHQDGKFPDLGWHVAGEMGGIWLHPIKLMDGFTASIVSDLGSFCLDSANSFTNYPFANLHYFEDLNNGLQVKRLQFVPDGKEGMTILFRIKNVDNSPKSFEFVFEGKTDLRPVWLGEQTGMLDYSDDITYDEVSQVFSGKDQGNNWFAVWATSNAYQIYPVASECRIQSQGKGASAGFGTEIKLEPGEEKIIPVFIAGSTLNQMTALETLASLRNELWKDWSEKKIRYEEIQALADIQIPDPDLQLAFEWVKYNTDWLIRDVPEIGRGIGAGLQDYPWWFGVDSEYTLKGLIATGRKDLVYSTIELIHSLSEKENGNGRIIHEVSTNGEVFNAGNLNETPQFASLIWEVYRWTGDRIFVEKYFPTIEKGLQWLLEQDHDGNLVADGYGMMEIHGLQSEMIDVAAYSQRAFADASQLALVLGKNSLALEYQTNADQLKTLINTDFWVEEFDSFADFIGTVEEALELIDGAIIRADTLQKPWAVAELKATKSKLSALPKTQKQGFVLYHNWVVNTPMEMGIADPEKAKIALNTARNFTNPFGMFVTGIDRDALDGEAEGSFAGSKVFSYTGAVMTLPTGVQAVSENNYGNPDAALDYLKRMTRSFGFALPGSIYEVSPDYGMFSQAWNMYSFGVPLITQFFGVQPDAANKLVHIRPQMPTDWQEASIQRLVVGDNELTIYYANKAGVRSIEVTQTQSKWGVSLEVPADFSKVLVLGKEVNTDTKAGFRRILMTGKKMKIEARL